MTCPTTGLERLPTAVALAVPPVVGAFVPVFGRAALDQPDVAPELNGLRRLADPVLLATVGLLAARQLLLIALNR